MSAYFLTAAADLLEKVALGVPDSEIDRLVEAVKEASRGESDTAGFDEFRLQVSAIRQVLKDNALNERGLNS